MRGASKTGRGRHATGRERPRGRAELASARSEPSWERVRGGRRVPAGGGVARDAGAGR